MDTPTKKVQTIIFNLSLCHFDGGYLINCCEEIDGKIGFTLVQI